jgi:nucleoid DNA-binding protein
MAAKSLTFTQFCEKVAKETGATKKEARDWVETVFGTVEKNLTKGVRIPQFGKFQVRKLKARIGRNPATGEKIKIPARQKVAFSPAKDLKEKFNKGGKKKK